MFHIRKIFAFAILIFLSNYLFAQTATAPTTGDGTAANPYRIDNLENLYWLSQSSGEWGSDKYFIQTASIDASATANWFPDGAGGYYGFPVISGYSLSVGNQVAGTFQGHYDGQGYTIRNLYINRSPDYVALFGYCNGAVIRNLNLESPTVLVGRDGGSISSGYQGCAILMASGSATLDNVHILYGQLTANTWHGYVGGMLGRPYSVTAANCSVQATITITTDYGGSCGGFMGYSEMGNSQFTNCSSSGSLSSTTLGFCGGFVGANYAGTYAYDRCFSTMQVNSTGYNGGFCGGVWTSGTSFTDCYAMGDVSGNNSGGFFGYSGGGVASFKNCYATGLVSGSGSGGFGRDAGSHTYSNCFWDTETTQQADGFAIGSSGDVMGKSSQDMKTLATFTGAGWDLQGENGNGTNDYWSMSADNNGYPALVGDIRWWNGWESSDWSDSRNWRDGILPSAGSIVKIGRCSANSPLLSSPVTIDRFDFNDAYLSLDLGNSDLTCSQVLGYNPDYSLFIRTTGTGTLKINLPDNGFGYFPVGNNAPAPVTITNRSGNPDVFSVNVLDEVYLNGSNGATLAASRVKHTWNIEKASPNNGSGVDFVFAWDPANESASMTSPTLFHYSGHWQQQTGGALSADGKSFTYTGYTGSFSPFSVMDANATLPVSRLSFAGVLQGSQTVLNWSTAQEFGTKEYEIQHSADGSNWHTIGTKPAAGNSGTEQRYVFVHTQPIVGANYYRLGQQDASGKQTFSKVVTVYMTEAPTALALYPNPVQGGRLTVQIAKPATVRVYNAGGAMVMQQTLGAGTHTLQLGNLPRGVYSLKAGSETKAFVVQ